MKSAFIKIYETCLEVQKNPHCQLLAIKKMQNKTKFHTNKKVYTMRKPVS